MGAWQAWWAELTLRGQLHVCSTMFKEKHFLQEPVINSLSEQNFQVASDKYIVLPFSSSQN